MKKNVLRLALFLGMAFLVVNSYSQSYEVKQLIVANGGVYEFSPPYSDHVTVESYDPQTGTATIFDTIYTESVQDVVISSHYAYVSAQDSLVMYDIDSYHRVAAVAVTGINLLKIWNGNLIVGRGNGVLSDFVQMYDATNLNLVSTIAGISDETYGIEVVGDTAYVAIPGNWMSVTGKIAVIDLQNKTLVREMDLGSNGKGMREIIANGNDLYIFNTMGYGDTYGILSKYNIISGVFTHQTINLPFGNGYNLCGIGKHGSFLYAVINGKIVKYDLANGTIADSSLIVPQPTIAEAVIDTIHDNMYFTTTNYTSAGSGWVFSLNGDSVATFTAGISAQAMAVDYRHIVSVENSEKTISFVLYPNPCHNRLFVETGENITNYAIFDLTGKVVSTGNSLLNNEIPVNLEAGIYIIKLYSERNSYSYKIIVE